MTAWLIGGMVLFGLVALGWKGAQKAGEWRERARQRRVDREASRRAADLAADRPASKEALLERMRARERRAALRGVPPPPDGEG